MGTEMLWRLPFCKLMSSNEVTEIRTLSREHSLAKGQVLFREGTLADAAYVVVSGALEVRKSVSGVGETAIATLGPSSIVGEMALLTEAPRSATVVALEDAELLQIPKAAFEALLKRQSVAAFKVCQNLAIMLSERLQRLNRELVRLTAELATHRTPLEVDEFRKLLSQWSF